MSNWNTPVYNLRLNTLKKTGRKNLHVTFNNSLRNDTWSLYGGSLQRIIATSEFQTEIFLDITFNLSYCIWIDPGPLMSILISANIFKEKTSGAVNFILADFNREKSSINDKVLKFLATEGFLDEIYKVANNVYFNKKIQSEESKETIIKKISELDAQLNYTNCTVVKVRVMNTMSLYKSKHNLEDWLNNLLSEAKVRLSGKESDLVVEDILYKIKILLDETLQNINRHAYEEDEDQRWAAIYLRFRYGTQNKTLSIDERRDLQKNIESEILHCPRLDSQFVNENNGFVEIFILDNGMGISSSFVGKDKRLEFRNSVSEILRNGARKKSSINRNMTARGGLNLIYDLLKQEHDYICGYSDSEWIGDSIPFQKTVPYFFNDPEKSNSVCVSGLCWIVRLSMNSNYQLNLDDWKTWDGTILKNPAFLGYNDDPLTQKELNEFRISDERFTQDDSPVQKKILHSGGMKMEENTDIVVLFTSPFITKIKVWDIIYKQLSDLPDLTSSNNRVLIIGDIPEKEALVYTSALIDVKIYDEKQSWKSKVSDIVLVTQKYYVCVLQKSYFKDKYKKQENVTFKKDEDFAQVYVDAVHYSKESLPNPANSLREYVNFLKSYDSKLFWGNLSNHPLRDYLFVNQKIPWAGKKEKINGYLNFSLTLTESKFIRLYKLLLTRSYGLIQNKTAVLRNIDELTGKLCEEFNNNFRFDARMTVSTLYIGSVYGSGMHERNTLADFPRSQGDLVINFFIMQDLEQLIWRISLLYWPSQKELDKYAFLPPTLQFERIGRTHSIAAYGWKYFPIPRYDENSQSFYKRTPPKTYEDWQSINNPIISFGNISYQGFTDLITVDLKKAVEYSFKYKTELSIFLMEEFSYIFKASQEIDFKAKDYYQLLKKSKTSKIELDDFYEGVGLVVYPNHINTSLVIENIRSNFAKQLDADQLIPIDFTQSYHETTVYLIDPLTLDRIKNSLQKQKDRGNNNVLFFDCTIVSGKTRRQIYHIIKGLGAEQVKSLTLLDRSRLPYTLPNHNDIRAYWRLDIPRLSYGGHNTINSTLNEISQLRILFTKPAKDRFDKWEIAWSNSNLGIHTKEHGIGPSRLIPEAQMSKKFAIDPLPPHDQIGGPENKIDLVNSFGLIIYCAEAHSMTGKDDIALNIIKKSSLPPSIIIELISSQLLLFPHDFSRDLRLEMLMQLFQASLSIRESDNHTALAAIVLISQKESIISSLLKKIFEIQNIHDTIFNLDLRICVGYIIAKYGLYDLYDINSYDSIMIKYQNDNLWQIYKKFHFEIYEGTGKMHSRPILDIYSSEPIPFEQKLQDAIVSFSRLQSIFQEDIKEWFIRTNLKIISHTHIVAKMEELYNDSLDILKSRDTSKYLNFSQKIKNEIVPYLKEVHNSLFYLIKTKNDSVLNRQFNLMISTMINNISSENWKKEAHSKKRPRFANENPVIYISSYTPNFPDKYENHDNLWIVFDRRVQEELQNLFYNAIYAGKKFRDPKNLSDPRLADMWVWVEYLADGVTIHFQNDLDEPFENVKREIIKGHNDAHRHCVFEKALDGECTIEYIESEKLNFMDVTLTLPIL